VRRPRSVRRSRDRVTSDARPYRLGLRRPRNPLARSILDRVAIGIAVSDERTGRFIFANRTFAALLGYESEELVGMRPRDLHPPEVVPELAAAFRHLRPGSGPIGPVPVVRKDGSVILAEVTAFRGELDGRRCAIGVFADVTDRVRAERLDQARSEILAAVAGGEAEEAILRRIVALVREGIPGAVAAIFLRDDAAALRLAAAPDFPPELVSHLASFPLSPSASPCPRASSDVAVIPIDLVTHPALADPARAAVLAAGFRTCWSEPVRVPSGDVIGAVAACFRLGHTPTAGELHRLHAAASFVALALERSRAIAERLERSATEAATRARSALLANLGHEIRTPLNAVIGFAELLLDDPSLHDRHRERLRLITRSGDHLVRLVTDLLDAARFDAPGAVAAQEPFALRATIDDAMALFRARALAKGLAFDVDVAVPERAIGDAHLLRRVLINLLGNAVKFTSCGAIALTARYGGGRLTIDVQDSGPGISASDRERIFDAFFQGAAGLSMGGSGLGLPISRQLVALMGGRLTLLDAAMGSRFRIELPLPIPSDAVAPDDGAVRGAAAPIAASERTTLQAILAAATDADVVAVELFDAHRDRLRAALGGYADHLGRHLHRFDFPTVARELRALLADG
jgi:PAS domain S-box-containing protein